MGYLLVVGAEGREEGVGDVLDSVVVGGADDGNDVELGFVGEVVGADIHVGGTADACYFTAVDGVGGVNVIVGAGFDFDKDDVFVLHRHDVDFVVTGAPISVDDSVTFSDEEVAGELFAPITSDVMFGH